MPLIAVATDFSARSDRALRRATLVARGLQEHQADVEMCLLHVVDDDQPAFLIEDLRQQSEKLLRKLCQTAREVDGVDCAARIITADPFAGVVQLAEEMQPDLLVLGATRRQLLKEVFTGTTAERVLRSVQCPTLMTNAVPAAPYRRPILTTDLSDASGKVLGKVMQGELLAGLQPALLHMFNVPALDLTRLHTLSEREREFLVSEERRRAEAELATFAAAHRLDDMTLLLEPVSTTTPRDMIAAAQKHAGDLLVVSTHGRSGLGRMVLGSVAAEVLAHSPLDVLAVPPPA